MIVLYECYVSETGNGSVPIPLLQMSMEKMRIVCLLISIIVFIFIGPIVKSSEIIDMCIICIEFSSFNSRIYCTFFLFPFLQRICSFCSFNKYPLSKKLPELDSSLEISYRNSMVQEIHRLHGYERRYLASIYFGGGSPSLLSVGEEGLSMITMNISIWTCISTRFM